MNPNGIKIQNENALRQRADELANKKRGDAESAWNDYLGANSHDAKNWQQAAEQPLLAFEMQEAEKDGRVPPCLNPNQITLVVLLGESFEPLLQTIWTYKPRRIVPIVNTYYIRPTQHRSEIICGEERWSNFEIRLERLYDMLGYTIVSPKAQPTDPSDEKISPVEEKPTKVFEHLRGVLKEELKNGTPIVVDITGAKKTMVTGAFLFAAYANLPISYMDYARVDDEGKPYSYSCHMDCAVENPLKEFGILEWEHAAAAYSNEDFHGVQMRLQEILEKLKATELENFLEMLRLWRDRDFAEASKMASQLSDATRNLVPRAVNDLRGRWNLDGANPRNFFLLDPRLVLVYANDEFMRVKRLREATGEKSQYDYRAAFTRAYALHETLLKARVFLLLKHNFIKLKIPNQDPVQPTPLQVYDENTQHVILKWFVEELRTEQVKNWLLSRTFGADMKLTLSDPAHNSYLFGERRGTPFIPPTVLSHGRSEESSHKQVRDKRNAITHGFIQVTDTDVGNAIAFVEKNIENYRDKWARWQNESLDVTEFQPASLEMPEKAKCYAAPEWDVLLTACGLSEVSRLQER